MENRACRAISFVDGNHRLEALGEFMSNDIDGIILVRNVCRKLNCTPRYLKDQLKNAGLSIVELSARKRGLRESDYVRLLELRTKRQVPAP